MKQVSINTDYNWIYIKTGERLLDALLAKKVAVKMLCQGRGLCATCHVYVTRNPQCLTPQTEREKLTLTLLTGTRPNSRLACQAKVLEQGVEIELPEGLYVESFSELKELIGKRSKTPILHPINGKVLVEENKIITRTAIMQLKDVDFNVREISLQ